MADYIRGWQLQIESFRASYLRTDETNGIRFCARVPLLKSFNYVLKIAVDDRERVFHDPVSYLQQKAIQS